MTRVSDWMTREIETVRPGDSLAEAEAKMRRGRFRHLPVIGAGGELLGLLTERALHEHVGYLDSTRVTASMVDDVLTIAPEESIERAAEIVLERKFGALPVTSGGKLVGIITETDLLAGLLRRVRREPE